MTEEDIEAEWWAHHYQNSTATAEFDDDDENAASDYLAQIEREAEEAAASGESPQPEVAPDDWGPEE